MLSTKWTIWAPARCSGSSEPTSIVTTARIVERLIAGSLLAGRHGFGEAVLTRREALRLSPRCPGVGTSVEQQPCDRMRSGREQWVNISIEHAGKP